MTPQAPPALPPKRSPIVVPLPRPTASAPTGRPLPAGRASDERRRQREWLFRLVVLGLLVLSATLAWWSFARQLLPLQRQSRELSTQVGRLSTEVETLELSLARKNPQRIAQRAHQAQERLFSDEMALANWVVDLKQTVLPLAIGVKTDFGKTVPRTPELPNLALIPTTLSLEVDPTADPAATGTAYQRVLRLTQRLSAQEKRADLTELRLLVGTNSIATAALVFQLWAGQEEHP